MSAVAAAAVDTSVASAKPYAGLPPEDRLERSFRSALEKHRGLQGHGYDGLDHCVPDRGGARRGGHNLSSPHANANGSRTPSFVTRVASSNMDQHCVFHMAQTLVPNGEPDVEVDENGVLGIKKMKIPSGKTCGMLKNKFLNTMRSFLASHPIRTGAPALHQATPAARRAIVTASLGVLRGSCAPTIPSQLSHLAVNTLLGALGHVIRQPSEDTSVASTPTSANVALENGRKQAWPHEGSGQHYISGGAQEAVGLNRQRQPELGHPTVRGCLHLGAKFFPEAQVAAFLIDATRIGGGGAGVVAPAGHDGPLQFAPPITVPAQLSAKIITTFGVGAAMNEGRLQWGYNPAVIDALQRAVRRVAEQLRQEADWVTLSRLARQMASERGATHVEQLLGINLGELVSQAMLSNQWTAAKNAVGAAAPGEQRRALARALIPAAIDARVFDVATALMAENNLEAEYPPLKLLERKRKLLQAVKKPGWKMAQSMLQRNSMPFTLELRIWLTQHMIEKGDLPAAAQLMDAFNLHGQLPRLDPVDVENCARARAAAHLQIPLDNSRVFVVDDTESLSYAKLALASPPRVGGTPMNTGVACVGLDVEDSILPPYGAKLLQVATGTEVFLFDLPILCARSYSQQFNDIIVELFRSQTILKLGFCFSEDLANLKRSWPYIEGFRHVVAHLEIKPVSTQLLGVIHTSLSKQCQAWLGKPLDKTECTSNWGRRPLTVDQVRYAALDAHCLVGIFEEMMLEQDQRSQSVSHPADKWWREHLKTFGTVGPQKAHERST